MGAKVEELTRRIKAALRDVNQDSWPDETIWLALLEAENVIVNQRLDATSVMHTMDLAPGIEQTLAGITTPPANRLLNVKHNMVGNNPGKGVRRVGEGDLDAIAPNWRSEQPSQVIREFTFDEREPLIFYVRPPAAAGARLRVSYSAVPQPYGVVGPNTETTISSTYEPLLIEWALYRLFGHDTEGSVNVTRSQQHLNNFNQQMERMLQGVKFFGPKNPEYRR